MSRSIKHSNYVYVCGGASEAWDKAKWHRRFRRAIRRAIRLGIEPMPHFREYSDPWAMYKDGPAIYLHDIDPKILRK